MKCCIAIFTSYRNLAHEYKILTSFSLKAWLVKWSWGKNCKGLFMKSAQLLVGMSTRVNMAAIAKWSKLRPFLHVSSEFMKKRGWFSCSVQTATILMLFTFPPDFLEIDIKSIISFMTFIFMMVICGLNFLQKTGLF